MPVTSRQLQAAQALQSAAARDQGPQVRLIAGPGTGKSFTIEDRVSWLLGRADPQRIFAISFTNASAQDLRGRVLGYCQARGQDAGQVSVTTMHSLALRMLRTAGLLQRFPASPLVLDQWEIENLFTAEFCAENHIGSRRAGDIRRDREAYWSTGTFNPPNFIPPAPPITTAERAILSTFINRFEQLYSCILPGEIVRECVDQIRAGAFNPGEIVPVGQLIVDEYQDLNPIDLEFVDAIIGGGAVVFVAGDDDQSIYSFRYALPRGIQNFLHVYPNCGDHSLEQCFRCSTLVLAAAQAVIAGFPSANRIPKNLISVYDDSEPPIEGYMVRSVFQNGADEARSIAASCRTLIDAGISANEILILISDRNVLEGSIVAALEASNVPADGGEQDRLSTDEGRALYDILRILTNESDYIAIRSLQGLLQGVGVTTCLSIEEKVVVNNLNYRDLFYGPLPTRVFTAREAATIRRIADVCAIIATWNEGEDLDLRRNDLIQVAATFGEATRNFADRTLAPLPGALTLSELREMLGTTSKETIASLLSEAYQRMGQVPPAQEEQAAGVRLMTMHGAKGLSARIVFIPGLEEDVFPGPRRRPYPGLIEEAARLLYVSITRARVACFLSFARRRVVHGRLTAHASSRFNVSTGGPFVAANTGITRALAERIVADTAQL